jgi:hypothetical protein
VVRLGERASARSWGCKESDRTVWKNKDVLPLDGAHFQTSTRWSEDGEGKKQGASGIDDGDNDDDDDDGCFSPRDSLPLQVGQMAHTRDRAVLPARLPVVSRSNRQTAPSHQGQFSILAEHREPSLTALLLQVDPTSSAAEKGQALNQHANLHDVLFLAEILYLPFDEPGEGVVGEEILDWVNRAHLLSASALLSLPLTHPSPTLRSLFSLALDLLQSFPRSTAFRDEREFLTMLSERRGRAKNAMMEVELFAGAEGDDVLGTRPASSFPSWPILTCLIFDLARLRRRRTKKNGSTGKRDFRCLFSLLAGTEKRILEASEDWRKL